MTTLTQARSAHQVANQAPSPEMNLFKTGLALREAIERMGRTSDVLREVTFAAVP